MLSQTASVWGQVDTQGYAYLEKEFSHINFFVYGGGGYGSLQEYMIWDDYIDEIDPDIVIWQFCINDYWNNSYDYKCWLVRGG